MAFQGTTSEDLGHSDYVCTRGDAAARQLGFGGWAYSLFVAWLSYMNSSRYERYAASQRKRLFADIRGAVLEIGPGTGINLKYVPVAASWTGIDPNPYMLRYALRRAESLPQPVRTKVGVAEELPFPDESVEAVVGAFVLCSVRDPGAALKQIVRVLKPGGSFRFLEHTAAPKGTVLRMLQDRVTPCWRIVADRCCLNRDLVPELRKAGFERLELDSIEIHPGFFLMRRHIAGIAFKGKRTYGSAE